MSLWRDDTAASPAAVAILGGLGLVAVLSLSRAFAGLDYLAWALPATAIGAAFAAVFGRRSLALGLGLLILAAFLTLPVLFVRELTAGPLPTMDSYRLVWTLLSSGFGGVLHEAAPVPADTRYLLVVWTSGLLLSFLAAAWVVVRKPMGALITVLGIVAFAGAVGEGPGRETFGAATAIGGLALLLVDGRHRIARWARHRMLVPAAVGIPTLLAAFAAALASPAVLGADKPLFDLDTTLRPRLVIIKPLADIQRQLQVDPPIEVMRVRADQPAYWRLTALDAYDGSEWFLRARPEEAAGDELPQPDIPPRGNVVGQEYSITSLLAPWLPAAFVPSGVDVAVPFEIDRPSSTLLLQGETVPGLNYRVVSTLPRVDANVGASMRESRDATERLFADLARPLVEHATTPLDAALALERHFRTFSYDEDVPGGHSVERLLAFLEARTGYCEQFAATMTLMLRGLGIPARVGVGFLPGGFADDQFVVSTRDAHAWVEADIPEVGWTSFDPTPGRGDPTGQDDAEQEEPAPPPPAADATPPPPSPAVDEPQAAPETEGAASRIPVLPLALLALILGAAPAAKEIRRRTRRSGPPHESVVGAWLELVDRSSDLGWRGAPTETEIEFQRRVFAGTAEGSRQASMTSTTLVLQVLYGSAPVSRADADTAWSNVRAAVSGLRRAVPWWRRALAVFDPRTLLPALPPLPRPAGA